MKMSNFVRITIDKTSPNFVMEKGTLHPPGLTPEEDKELRELTEELKEFKDFATAEDLENGERRDLLTKRRRQMELRGKQTEDRMEWIQIPTDSLLAVCRPNRIPTVVENMPEWLFEKIMENEQTVNISIATEVAQETGQEKLSEFHPSPDDAIKKVVNILNDLELTDNWSQLVSVNDHGNGRVTIKPKGFLQEDWSPINNALKKRFGDCWKSQGKGDKDAHWLCKVK